MKRTWTVAALSTAGVVATSLSGIRFSPADAEIGRWYQSLEKPPFNPPDWLFGPVWSTLYVLMVVAAVRASRTEDEGARREATLLWWSQLALNAAWTPLFFGARKPALALADLAALLALLIAWVVRVRRNDAPAAWLFTPYVAWVTFAGLLNAEIVRRNS